MKATLDFNLEPTTDDQADDQPERGTLRVSVADARDNGIIGGATIEVTAPDGSFRETAESGSMAGMATVQDVPVGDLRVTVSKTGFNSQTKTVTAGSFQ